MRAASSSKVLIIGQAPGARAHESGVPWDDRSGERLRDWMQVSAQIFYDEGRIAIMPMGFCFPGVNPKGGDNPPRPECAPAWHARLLDRLPQIEMTLLVGSYAQARYLEGQGKKTMTATVADWRAHAPKVWPLPHPSWRNTGWLKKNPWFETDLLPVMRKELKRLL